MHVFRNKTWISCGLLLGLHQISQKLLSWEFNFIDHYLDPFLSIPFLLGLILLERRFLIGRYSSTVPPNEYQLTRLEIVISTIFFALLFEEGFPKWSIHFTKDYWDYLAYFSGALMFHLFINKPSYPLRMAAI